MYKAIDSDTVITYTKQTYTNTVDINYKLELIICKSDLESICAYRLLIDPYAEEVGQLTRSAHCSTVDK